MSDPAKIVSRKKPDPRILIAVAASMFILWLLSGSVIAWLSWAIAGAVVVYVVGTVTRRRRAGRTSVLVLVLLVVTVASISGIRGRSELPGLSTSMSAAWVAHEWVGREHTQDELGDFARSLKAHRIQTVFAHSGPLEPDGSVRPDRYRFAAPFLRETRRIYPEVRIQAWLGSIEARGGGDLDLSDAQTRERIVVAASTLLDLGFDGIHYDIEPIQTDDARFLDLLDRTAALTRDRGAKLSVAGEDIEPLGRLAPLARRAMRGRYHAWSAQFMRDVARRADQIAVMTYGSAMPTGSLYSALVRWETRAMSKAVPASTEVLIGIPTYDEPDFGHRPKAENIRYGINGVRRAVARIPGDRRSSFGVAIYAEWTTDESEWDLLARTWTSSRDTVTTDGG